MKFYITLFALLVNSIVQAESIGIQALATHGLTEGQCKTLMTGFNGVKNPKLSFLWSTFDRKQPKNFDCVKYFLRKFKNESSVLQVYADNSTCRRPPRFCEKTEVAYRLRLRELNTALEHRDKTVLRDYRRRGRDIVNFLSRYSKTQTQISFVYALEDDFSSKAFRNLRKFIEADFPDNWLKGRNPNGNRQARYDYGGLDFVELHGFDGQFDGRAFSISNDGIDVDFGDGSRALDGNLSLSAMFNSLRQIGDSGNSIYRWIWWNNQGIESHFIVPSRRHFQISLKHILLINKELRNEK